MCKKGGREWDEGLVYFNTALCLALDCFSYTQEFLRKRYRREREREKRMEKTRERKDTSLRGRET